MSDETADDAVIKTIGKGTVIFWKNFEFENGEKKDSLFLVLTDGQRGCLLAIRASTKTEFYEKPSAVAREFIIVPKKSEAAFPAKSVIDFARIKILYWQKMKLIWDKDARKIHPASDGLIDQIDKLVSNSKIVRRDWIKWITNSPRQNK